MSAVCFWSNQKTAATPRTLVPYSTCRITSSGAQSFVGDVEQRLKHILYGTAQQYGVLIETMEVMSDHVHLFVLSDPTRCMVEIVNRLKGASSRARASTTTNQAAQLTEIR